MLQNKYSKWYSDIIQKAQTRVLDRSVYSERHHILPKSLGGGNSKENLVKLTAREHFICHLCLTKCTEGKDKAKMVGAIWIMCKIKRHNSYCKMTAKIYKKLKEEYSKIMTERNNVTSPAKLRSVREKCSRRNAGPGNPMHGRTHTLEVKETNRKINCCYEYEVIFPDGSREKITSLRKFTKENNLDFAASQRVAKGKQKQHKGFSIKIINIINNDKFNRQNNADYLKKITEKQNLFLNSLTNSEKEIIKLSHCKNVFEITHPNGEVQIVKNLKKFAIKHHIPVGSIYRYDFGNNWTVKNFNIKILGEIQDD